MIDALKSMLTSRKAIVAVGGVIVTLAAKYGLELDPETINRIVALAVAYILGVAIEGPKQEAK